MILNIRSYYLLLFIANKNKWLVTTKYYGNFYCIKTFITMHFNHFSKLAIQILTLRRMQCWATDQINIIYEFLFYHHHSQYPEAVNNNVQLCTLCEHSTIHCLFIINFIGSDSCLMLLSPLLLFNFSFFSYTRKVYKRIILFITY